jgi:hypothetical protein
MLSDWVNGDAMVVFGGEWNRVYVGEVTVYLAWIVAFFFVWMMRV